MSKQHKFKEGDIVKHNYSTGYIGLVHEVRDDPKGYDYFVRFTEGDDPVPVAKDWFKEDVLVMSEAISKGETDE